MLANAQFMKSPEYTIPVMDFIDENCAVFDGEEVRTTSSNFETCVKSYSTACRLEIEVLILAGDAARVAANPPKVRGASLRAARDVFGRNRRVSRRVSTCSCWYTHEDLQELLARLYVFSAIVRTRKTSTVGVVAQLNVVC